MWPYLIHDSSCGCTTCTPSTNLCYSGPNLPNTGIQNNDTLSVALQKIDNLITTGGGGTQDLQSVLAVSSNFLFDGKSGGVLGGGDGVDRYTEFYYDDLAGRFSIFSIQENEAYIESNIDYGVKSSSFRAVAGMALIQQANPIGTTTVSFKEPVKTTSLSFPAKTVAGTYTLDVTSDTLYTVGTLPSGVLNDKAIVTDATAPTYLGVLVGGGSVVTPVWHNGTIWVAR